MEPASAWPHGTVLEVGDATEHREPSTVPSARGPGNSLLTLAPYRAHDARDNFQRREDVDKRLTQRAIIARTLSEDGMISARDMLFKHGISRTAARIAELRAIGWVIRTERKHDEMATYWLVEQ